MKCNEFETHALAQMDGTLSRRDAAAFERHLASCAACAERSRGFADVSRMLDTWEPIQPSASFNARLQQRILEQPAAASWWERLTLHLGLLPLSRPAAASAVFAMMLFAVVVVQYLPTTPDAISQNAGGTPPAVIVSDGDELALYQDLPVLENWEMLSNFEVLQELDTTTQ